MQGAKLGLQEAFPRWSSPAFGAPAKTLTAMRLHCNTSGSNSENVLGLDLVGPQLGVVRLLVEAVRR